MARGDKRRNKDRIMRRYKAVIVSNNVWPPDETNVAILKMEIDFTIGSNNKSDPEQTIKNTLADLHISKWDKIESITEVEPE